MRESQLSLPINIENKIANDDEVFTLEEICEEIDFSILKQNSEAVVMILSQCLR